MSECRASSKPTPQERPLAFLSGMIGTLYKNPRGYASTVGELDSLLWFTHFLWANIAGRNADYLDVRCRRYDENFARKVSEVRSEPISNAGALGVVIDLWRAIDTELNIDIDPDQWDYPKISD